MKVLITAILLVFSSGITLAQPDASQQKITSTKSKKAKMSRNAVKAPPAIINGKVLALTIVDGDTMPYTSLPDAPIYAARTFKSKSEEKRYRRLERHVRKVYPYAKLAGDKIKEFEADLATVESKRKQKKYYKMVEKELKDQFGDELKHLSITQGRILITLIDRETGDTSYELVSQMRGSFQAFLWQGLARMFGHNLKDSYDPSGDEQWIEEIVATIEYENSKT